MFRVIRSAGPREQLTDEIDMPHRLAGRVEMARTGDRVAKSGGLRTLPRRLMAMRA